jgi:hypothetical protein
MSYCVAEVRAVEDWNTKKITISGTLGVAPDEHTVIEYPVRVYDFGWFNRNTTRQKMQQVKRELLRQAKDKGYTREMFTKPIQLVVPWR